jgi:3-deoxy-D-manno-octulosonic-acid transferase
LALIALAEEQRENPRAILVLAPRNPEHFQDAADFIHESRRKFLRRSELPIVGNGIEGVGGTSHRASIPDDVNVLLLDSIGELASLYQLADGAFVGGSLVESGGHNILEPAAFGKIPVFGPSMENFAEIASRFVAAKAAVQVESPEDVGVAWIELLRDPDRKRQMGDTAKRLVDDSRGATSRGLAEIAKHLDGASR